uniref:IST1 homolog n=1 Tax=Florenciella parvula TaxID=236787 RepID=A0A7S2BH55_9STRA|mmetsp:Transcript_16775/g.35046  ORF Transcript_16775/g.35046 Transcript_16775/m.35046 type:complete len:421 (+) Transcript_16775:38-1300(+)|eukprot:CAMPEP_0182525536 /NCGR_PEP_ID=MMETSP1323-20130603/2552_1 /TAXON_ID=236787 /ORGANISM="Florenciella parvula, Strain RCC1693" /LENGTH=420 /DNA_ID=CAMNT_0024734259 /DNA_START=187 /DNA_END=1449 /DNA_ORIENTATION=-
MFGFFESFNPDKFKPYLKQAVHRFAIVKNKKTNLIKADKREIAGLLANVPCKEEKARIRVEKVIREDFTIEAFEILELLCELLHERVRLMTSEKDCPPDMEEAFCTLIWSANRVDGIPELAEIAKQLRLKYGKEFFERALANEGGCVNERVLHKLSIQPPTAYLVREYLQAIASEYNVDWTPSDVGLTETDMMSGAMPAPIGKDVPVAPGSGVAAPYSHMGGGDDRDYPPAGGGGGGGGGMAAEEIPPAYSPPGPGGGGDYITVDAKVVPSPIAGPTQAATPYVPPGKGGEPTIAEAKPSPRAPTAPGAGAAETPASTTLVPQESLELPSAPTTGGSDSGGGGGGGAGGTTIDDLQARLNGLDTGGGGGGGGDGGDGGGGAAAKEDDGVNDMPSVPQTGGEKQAPSDYNDLLARFNQLKE